MARPVHKNKTTTKGTGDPLLRMYLNDISKIPLLTVEEERELGRRIRSGDLFAFQKLVESNLRFVIKIAKKFVRPPNQLMELINAGNVGLLEAARRFNPEMNVRFTSYAVWWIRQAIFHHLANMTHAFRVSPKVANLLYKTSRVLNRSPLGSAAIPNRESLAEKVGVSIEELNSALEVIAGTVSLDQQIHEEGDASISDLIEQKNVVSPEEQAMILSLHRSLERTVGRLTPVEQTVIRLRFGLEGEPMTLQEVGNQLHLSRERIRQIESHALNKLKQFYSPQVLDSYLN